ncbi:O-antigen ligase family protein [Zhengella sp. ZM62]|uniref:O-antigen ligase family protein n=1 Tax=Zhengella sedimenti TaxID=3390035 RepID=UPI0039766E48
MSAKVLAVGLAMAFVSVLPTLAISHPALVLPLAAAPLGLIVMMRIPVWLVLGFVSFTFFRLHEAFPFLMPFRIPQLLALPTLLVLVWHIGVMKRIKPYWGSQLTAFAVFFALVTVGLPFASNPGIAIAYWTSAYVKIAIMTLSIAWLLRKPSDFQLAARVIVISGMAVSYVAITNKLAGIGLVEGSRVTIGREIGSVLGDPNDLSLVLTFPLSFAVSMATTRGGWFNRILGLAAIVLIIWAVLSTQSRGGILGIMSVFGVTGLRIVRSKLLLAGAGGLAAIVLFAAAGISDRSSGGAAEDGIDESAMGRIWAWTAALNMALARPLNGVGLDNFIPNYWLYTPHWSGFNKAVHSTWLGVLAETGWPGLIAFVAMVVAIARVAVRASRILRDNHAPLPVQVAAFSVTSGVAGFCASGTFLTQGFTWPIYILLAIASAASHFANGFAYGEPAGAKKPRIRIVRRLETANSAGMDPA